MHNIETMRELTPVEIETLKKRMGVVEADRVKLNEAAAQLQRAADAYEDCLAMITGGDKNMGVDLNKKTLIRKVES